MELYKKYRPQRWEDFIGQESTVNSLQTSVVEGKVPTGYLFAGKHGCGKTSAAFLLAKALNCENIGEDGNPCNKCDTCLSIDRGTQLGINYISMANKGNASDVRDLVEKAQFHQPVKKQVWILDECHNLSRQAFDALLIPLESENQNSLFIFCSTDPDKITPALKSRLSLRNFSPVKIEVVANWLKGIVQAEGLAISDEQIAEAAIAGNGSVRDSIQNLETISMNGALESSYISKVMIAILNKRYTVFLGLSEEIALSGQNFTKLTEQMYREFATYLNIAAGGDTVDENSERHKIAKAFGAPYIIKFLDILGNTIHLMSMNTVDNRILFEIAGNKMIEFLRLREKK